MSSEERDYIIEQVDKLIVLARIVGSLEHVGTEKEYDSYIAELKKQRLHLLSMDGIEL